MIIEEQHSTCSTKGIGNTFVYGHRVGDVFENGYGDSDGSGDRRGLGNGSGDGHGDGYGYIDGTGCGTGRGDGHGDECEIG